MKVLQRLRELEQGAQQFGGFSIPQTMRDALRLAADLSEENQALA
ncbi:hypothetical protein [Serratia odorifera]|nr:hypothetical protein [Serratia odorifera]